MPEVLGWALAAVFFLVGVRTTLTPTRLDELISGRDRLLIALHDASRAGFWLALAALFVGFSLVDDPFEFRWFVMVPIGMAAVRLLAAVGLSRRP